MERVFISIFATAANTVSLTPVSHREKAGRVLKTNTTRSMFDRSVADEEERSPRRSKCGRRRLDQQVGVNVDEQV